MSASKKTRSKYAGLSNTKYIFNVLNHAAATGNYGVSRITGGVIKSSVKQNGHLEAVLI